MKNIAVILAGGVGSRLGLNKPKQLLKVAGKTVIEHTIEVFQKHHLIDEILVVMHESYVHDIEEMTLKNNWTKVKKIINGGNERYESSLAAIKAASGNNCLETNIIFHDSVRPLVSEQIINNVIGALNKYEAVDVAITAVDTIIKVDEHKKFIFDIPDRGYLKRGQIPQGFRLNVIKGAYDLALKDNNFNATDDCGIVKKYLPQIPIFVVDGEEGNIKLTYPEDIYLLDKLFQIKSATLDDGVRLEDLNNKVLIIFGGNSGIGQDMVNIAKAYKAKVYSFSRSITGTDISSKEDIERALDFVYSKEGKIDFVVNTAAILNKEPIMNLNQEEIRKIIDVNYLGMVNITISAFKYLKLSNGHILHFTSSSYTKGRAFYSLYSSTKAAVVNFVQAIAEEWDLYNIKINCINPQRTKTPMRIKNFGIEDDNTLLKSEDVANISLKVLLSNFSGEVVDIKLRNDWSNFK